MLTQGLGAVINIVLVPIMIFGLLGFPAMGVAGAALATVVGQICLLILGLYLCVKKNPEIQLNFKGFKPSKTVIGRILSVGFPSILMNSISAIMTFGMNQILMAFSATATAVFGIYFKLQSFVFAGFGVISSSVFQALGNAVYSRMVSLVRQLLVILPVAWLLGRLGGLNAVWWAFPFAELLSVCMCALFLRKILQEKVDML